MHMFRRGAIDEICRNLNRQFLTRHDFVVKFNEQEGTALSIVYKDNPDWCFAMLYKNNGLSVIWQTFEAPGRLFFDSEISEHHHRYDAALNAAYSWVDRICDEILLAAKDHDDRKPVDALREKVVEAANNLPDPEKPFTTQELDEWAEKLKTLVSRIQELEQTQTVQQAHVDRILRELDDLKKRGTTVPKRTWLRTAGNKVLDLFDTASKEAVKKIAVEGTKFFLDYFKSTS